MVEPDSELVKEKNFQNENDKLGVYPALEYGTWECVHSTSQKAVREVISLGKGQRQL